MARQANPIKTPIELPELSNDIIPNQNQFIANSTVIIEQFGDGLPYEKTRVVNEARFFANQSAEAMLQFGKRLILIKENEPHGEFLNVLNNELNLPLRTARRVMQAAFKYLSPKLSSNVPALAHLGSTKLFELMVEDDEEIKALATGGTVANLTLDDVEKMTTRELKVALKKAKQDAKEQQAKIMEDYDAVLKRNADLRDEKEAIAIKLTQFEMKTIPLDERLVNVEKIVGESLSDVKCKLENFRQLIENLEKLQVEILDADPNYDPEQPYSLPESFAVSVQMIHGGIGTIKKQTIAIEKELANKFTTELGLNIDEFEFIMAQR